MRMVIGAARAGAVACFVLAHASAQTGSDQPATAPLGFVNFEMRYPGEVKDSAPAFATSADVDRARQVNDTVNGNITWQVTRLWTIAPDGPANGDCKTYALTKRHDLRLAGVPEGALRLVVVRSTFYEQLHMLLEIRGRDGVYVLDSLPAADGATFYPAAAMPTSYTVLKYEGWGRPEHWLAPSWTTARLLPAVR